MQDRLQAALSQIDTANAADPKAEALPYGERMSVELARLVPDASEVLQIAARGQHVERWLLPRADYPDGKAGYLAWRREQARRHADRVAGIMAIQDGVPLMSEGTKRIVAIVMALLMLGVAGYRFRGQFMKKKPAAAETSTATRAQCSPRREPNHEKAR